MAEWAPRRVVSDDDRKAFTTDYISLDPGETFTGYALFDGDPAKPEQGYYEYFEHWDTGGPGRNRQSVPCAGDDCLFCAEGDRPRSTAKAMFFVLRDHAGTEINAVRTMDLRPRLIKMFAALRKEGEKVKGRAFTIEKLDSDGNWSLIPKAAIKVLSAGDIKEHLKAAPNFENAAIGKIRQFMQSQGVEGALAAPDDGSRAPAAPAPSGGKGGKGGAAAPAAGKGGKGGKGAASAGNPWPDNGEDETVVAVELSVDGVNKMAVTSDDYDGNAILWGIEGIDTQALAEGEIVVVSWAKDSDGDFVLSAMEKSEAALEEEPAAEGFDPDAATEFSGLVQWNAQIENINYANVQTEDETQFAVYGIEGVDLTAFSEGDWLNLTAAKDNDGDWVASEVEGVEAPEGAAAAGEVPAKLEDVLVAVADVDHTQQTLDIENDMLGINYKLWFLSDGPAGGDNVDLNDYPIGTKIKVTAERDRDGDLVATVVPEIVGAAGAKGGKGGKSGQKGGKGGKGSS